MSKKIEEQIAEMQATLAFVVEALEKLGVQMPEQAPVVAPTPSPVVAPKSEESWIQYPFPKPLPRISSPFGTRTHPISKKRKQHNGTDFAAKSGTPIYAIADGTVVKSKKSGHYTGGYGQFIQIDHGNGIHSLYAHMTEGSRKVFKGDRVTKGQHIGDVGSTGYSTGPHLHFEIRKNGSFIDPMKYIASNRTSGSSSAFEKGQTSTGTKTHIVQRGDTLWALAKKYKTSVAELRRLNGIRGSMISVGQKLIIK